MNNIKPYLIEVLDSYITDISFYDQNLLLENLTIFFSKDQKQQLFNQIEEKCNPWYNQIIKLTDNYKECYYKEFTLFYKKMEPIKKLSEFYQKTIQINKSLLSTAIFQEINSSESSNYPVVKSIMNQANEETLMNLIDKGIQNSTKYNLDTISFT
ncbi:MAG: hypothetical protein OXC37_00785, partial [Bdellovibrionaceae bacterium]|nr:hypothetical protein [Pseudobdellovibrionaceae bacterium]